MSAAGFDRLQAVGSLEAAGFDPGQAEAVAATVDSTVGKHIAKVAEDMATKELVAASAAEVRSDFSQLRVEHSNLRAEFADLRADFAGLRAETAELRGEMYTEFAKLRAEVAVEFKVLYRHLWVMSAGIVGLTVTLVKVIP